LLLLAGKTRAIYGRYVMKPAGPTLLSPAYSFRPYLAMLHHGAAYYCVAQINFAKSVGGGLWHPESQALGAIRRDIDNHPDRLKGVLTNEGFVEEFFGGNAGSKKEEGKIVGMFAEHNGEDALKTAPKVCVLVSTSLYRCLSLRYTRSVSIHDG
jgi:hypothetical protein